MREISENVIDILTEFDKIESRQQLLIYIFVNGLNYEIKKLINIQEFCSNNSCAQWTLRAEKIFPHKQLVSNINDQNAPINRFLYKPICYYCNEEGHKN